MALDHVHGSPPSFPEFSFYFVGKIYFHLHYHLAPIYTFLACSLFFCFFSFFFSLHWGTRQ